MIKMVSFIKRRADLTIDEFKSYYETRHTVFASGYFPEAVRYLRRYITSRPDPDTGQVPEPDFDVVTEIWFPDEQRYEQAMTRLRSAEARAAFVADESNVFDRASIRRFVVVDEREGDPSLQYVDTNQGDPK